MLEGYTRIFYKKFVSCNAYCCWKFSLNLIKNWRIKTLWILTWCVYIYILIYKSACPGYVGNMIGDRTSSMPERRAAKAHIGTKDGVRRRWHTCVRVIARSRRYIHVQEKLARLSEWRGVAMLPLFPYYHLSDENFQRKYSS